MEFETWTRTKLIEEIISEIDLKKFRNNFPKYMEAIRLKDELHEKTDSELRWIYLEFKRHTDRKFMEKYYECLEQRRFFNRPESDADFIYWSKRPYWTIDEAAALILGKDPRSVTFDNVIPYYQSSAFAARFLEIRELAMRYVVFRELTNPTLPPLFLKWAEKIELIIPTELLKAVLEMHTRSSVLEQKYSQNTNTKEESVENIKASPRNKNIPQTNKRESSTNRKIEIIHTCCRKQYTGQIDVINFIVQVEKAIKDKREYKRYFFTQDGQPKLRHTLQWRAEIIEKWLRQKHSQTRSNKNLKSI